MTTILPDDPVFKLPLIALMIHVNAAELTKHQSNVLTLIIIHTFQSEAGVTSTFISLKAFENFTRYKPEIIQNALEFLIENRLVDRTYPDKSGLPFYAINPDPDTWTVWEDAPASSVQPQEGADG